MNIDLHNVFTHNQLMQNNCVRKLTIQTGGMKYNIDKKNTEKKLFAAHRYAMADLRERGDDRRIAFPLGDFHLINIFLYISVPYFECVSNKKKKSSKKKY